MATAEAQAAQPEEDAGFLFELVDTPPAEVAAPTAVSCYCYCYCSCRVVVA